MQRTLTLAALFTLATLLHAQNTLLAVNTTDAAALPLSTLSTLAPADLPDAPAASPASSSLDADSTALQFPATAGSANNRVAKRYTGIILPGQTALPLTAGEKVTYGLVDTFSPFNFIGATVSAGYSHVINSAPHYGTNSTAFGKREGVASLRAVVQTFSTDAIFSPVFHDDPRYYELGPEHSFIPRVWYAATRVVVVRNDSGKNTLNAPLLLGYGLAAGLNNFYYPDRDTGARASLQSYGGSLGGAALGFVVSEFLDDTLRAVHLRK